MSKLLDGNELAGYIKERQARQVRRLRQAFHTVPRLAIIKSTSASPVIDTYVRMKRRYAGDILIKTSVESLTESAMPAAIERLNADPTVHGIIVQLPLADVSRTDDIVNLVSPAKDVDGLGANASFISATAEAINWLLVGYNIPLIGKTITIIGNGRLVGSPLSRLWRQSDYVVTVVDDQSGDIAPYLQKSDIIVSATGVPGLITSEHIPIGAVLVDAGTASENGVIKGDIDPMLYETRSDLIITPLKGGVGPLTIATLFDHVITAAQRTIE